MGNIQLGSPFVPIRPVPARTPLRRQEASEERREAILAVGLAVFSADGFAAAKLDDAATKAGVAKGRIYLHLKDRQDLFEQIVRGAMEPIIEQLERVAELPDLPTDALLAKLFELFQSQVLTTDRRFVIRLALTEGVHFPEIASFYHREVVSRGLALLKMNTARGTARDEVAPTDLAYFPHLVFAPLAMDVMWDGLFSAFEPIDIGRLLSAHRQTSLGNAGRGSNA